MAVRGVWVVGLAAMLVSGCIGTDNKQKSWYGGSELSAARPSDELLYQGKLHFRNGDYGLAEKYFRFAVEQNPKSSDAWLGLAASYDRIRRFDLAERAYKVLISRVGYTPSVLNNLGFHNMLRGRLDEARKNLEAALEKDPDNPNVLNNLQLLETWATSHGGKPRRL